MPEYKSIFDSKKAAEERKQEMKEITDRLEKGVSEIFQSEKCQKKLPKVNELSKRYREVLAEKRKLYSEYKKARKEMMDIKIAKLDIDRFLKIDEEQHRKDKNKTQEHTR